MSAVHDFRERKSWAERGEVHALFDAAYWKAYGPGSVVRHPQDGQHQRAGIDTTIVLADAHVIRVDEKVRSEAYDDIALEYAHTNGKPGWVCKPLLCDVIAYAVLPYRRVYLLPVVPLQQAWRVHGEAWRKQYGAIEAPNDGYETLSCCVPVKDLFRAIFECMRVEVRA